MIAIFSSKSRLNGFITTAINTVFLVVVVFYNNLKFNFYRSLKIDCMDTLCQ